MKELTIEQKAKAYDEAIGKLREFYRDYYTVSLLIDVKEELANILPEIKESEDKKIVDELIGILTAAIMPKPRKREIFTWLEKQGEQKPTIIISKFRAGDWVVNNDSGVIQHIKEIVNVNDETLYVFDEDSVLDINFQEQYHLWTIHDAKDGDVLVCNDYPFLFSKYEIDEYGPVCCSYCGISNSDYGEFLINTNTKKYWCDIEFVNPATKEQRELLFQKMKEAGYMWDADKKKVVKCVIDEGKAEMDYCFTKMMNGEKVSSAWSEEDEKMIRGLIVICDEWTTSHSFYPIENCEMEKLKKMARIPQRQSWL